MAKTRLHELYELGQSAWLDNINRLMIKNGKLKEMIDNGLSGQTSNPTIFDKAISSSSDYDKEIKGLSEEGKSAFEIYDDLTVKDVQDAADLFIEVYKRTQGKDGYVSLEVNPTLAMNTDESIKECKRLHKKVNRPNVMFKIPSTNAGFPAIEELLSVGININITLIFSLEQYVKTAQAFLSGLEKFSSKGGDLSKVASVASVFVSRVDTAIDKMLEERITKETDASKKAKLESLKGKAAVAGSSRIFSKHIDIFSKEAFKKLESKGASIQRVLWGSTSTKNPAYNDIKYVTELIAKNTVNTIPEKTLNAFVDHGVVKEALKPGDKGSENILAELMKYGIDIDEVCRKLLEDGVASFEKSFNSLLDTIKNKSRQLHGSKK